VRAKVPLGVAVDAQRWCTGGLTQADICGCFNRAFRGEFLVHMVGGAQEPSYRPAPDRQINKWEERNLHGGAGVLEGTHLVEAQIFCREDFAQSALHEAAHWLIATPGQRRLEDYGHLYIPPPRKPGAQARFYAAELPVQALECWLSRHAGLRFQASADDPDCVLSALANFQQTVEQLATWYDTAVGGLWVPPLASRLADFLEAQRGGR